jgi:hypothetical protein
MCTRAAEENCRAGPGHRHPPTQLGVYPVDRDQQATNLLPEEGVGKGADILDGQRIQTGNQHLRTHVLILQSPPALSGTDHHHER